MVVSSLPPLAAHQVRAIEHVKEHGSVFLRYGRGVGKTRIFLEIAAHFLDQDAVEPVLLVVPNALIGQLLEELVHWIPELYNRTVVLRGPLADRALQIRNVSPDHLVVTSTESLSSGQVSTALARRAWSAILVDELSRFRSWSRRTRALQALGKRTRVRVGGSGNILVRSPMDLWYPLNWITPNLFNIRQKNSFLYEYCVVGGFTGREPIGLRPDRVQQLKDYIDSVSLECRLEDIQQMPERHIEIRRVPLHAEAAPVYARLHDELRLDIERASDADFALQIRSYTTRAQKLLEISAGFIKDIGVDDYVPLPSSKTAELIEMLEDDTEPTIVYVYWRREYEMVAEALKSKRIRFATQETREKFLTGKANVILLSLSKGAWGLNLQRASRIIYHSLPWDLDMFEQSLDRNWRMTTTIKDNKEVVYLVTRSTVDERVLEVLRNKGRLTGSLNRSSLLTLLGARR